MKKHPKKRREIERERASRRGSQLQVAVLVLPIRPRRLGELLEVCKQGGSDLSKWQIHSLTFSSAQNPNIRGTTLEMGSVTGRERE